MNTVVIPIIFVFKHKHLWYNWLTHSSYKREFWDQAPVGAFF